MEDSRLCPDWHVLWPDPASRLCGFSREGNRYHDVVSEADMQLHILGRRVRLIGDDGVSIPITRRQVRQLLTLLAIADDNEVPVDVLAAQLRDTSETTAAVKSLKQAVYNARAVLPANRLITESGSYHLCLHDQDEVDLKQQHELVNQARALRGVDPIIAVTLYRHALNLWGSRPLGDLPDTEATRPLFNRLLAELRGLREELAEVALDIGQNRELASEGLPWLDDDPLSDHLRGYLMIALYRCDRKGDALHLYQEARDMLHAEPSIWLQRIADKIRVNDPSVRRATTAVTRPTPDDSAMRAGIDTEVVSPARLYDYLLGGQHNFDVDRQAAALIMNEVPHLRTIAQANRYFLTQAVRSLAKIGIRQFLDVGSGLPTADNVHQVARRVTPDARVVYVDNDPTVLAHGRALLAGDQTTALINGDLRHPAGILTTADTRRLIDTGQPTAVLLCAVAHFLPLDEAMHVVRELLKPFPSGSHLILSHVTTEGSDESAIRRLTETARTRSTVRVHARTREEILQLFDGLELLEPGLVYPGAWRNEHPKPEGGLRTLGGVGRKP